MYVCMCIEYCKFVSVYFCCENVSRINEIRAFYENISSTFFPKKAVKAKKVLDWALIEKYCRGKKFCKLLCVYFL